MFGNATVQSWNDTTEEKNKKVNDIEHEISTISRDSKIPEIIEKYETIH